MTGMGGNNYSVSNQLVVNMFHHAIFHNAIYWILALGLVLIAIAALRGGLSRFNLSENGLAEPRSRSYLRIGFGLIWLVDGILQFQVSMPLGLANDVVRPMAVGTPGFLHSWMLSGILLWNEHPIALAVGTAWIQVGIGILLLVSNGAIGRLAAAVSVGWAFLIWLIGNGAGGIFQNTSSILFGWPGATLFYVLAGVALVLNNELFTTYFAKTLNKILSVLLIIGALLQCLPDRGFWHGGNSNALSSMASTMTATPQPHVIAWLMNKTGTLAGTMGGGFNLVVIFWLVITGVGLWLTSTRSWNWPNISLAVGAVVFWFVAEDAPLWGGLATDLNSLMPLAVLAFCSRSALVTMAPLQRRLPKEMRSSTGVVLASWASAMIIFSVISMFIATIGPAEATLFEAQNGGVTKTNTAAPPFTLVDQHGVRYTLGEHPGRYTILSFLDPRCWTDCPLLAAQLKQVRSEFPKNAPLDIVSVAADPYHEQISDLNHFIKLHDLGSVPNFYYVTGPLKTMQNVWNSYGIGVSMKPTDKMSIHSDFMFILGPNNRLRAIIPDDPSGENSVQVSAEEVIHSLLVGFGLK